MSDARETYRLFFALEPDEAVRVALAKASAQHPRHAYGKPVDVAQLHLTLRFLGGYPHRPNAVIDSCRAAAATIGCAAFHLVVERAGGFARAKVGWLAPSGNSGLDALWSALGHALDEAGVAYRAEETFAPHVTVLRGLAGATDDAAIDPVSWPITDFVLVHSFEGRYEVVGRWALA